MGRLNLLALAQSLLGHPYIWGAKGDDVFDCSGFVTWLLRKVGGPDWRYTHNAQNLFDSCPPIPEADEHLANITKGAPIWPCPGVVAGDLAFYGQSKTHVDHVMLCLDSGEVIGASGGNHYTTTPRPGACVQVRAKVDYRPDFLGFRRFPFVVTLEG